MLTAFIQAAMRHATYEKMEDGAWFGEVPPLEGVWASAETEAACKQELQEALEDWIVFSLSNGFEIPGIDGIVLTSARVA